MKRILAGVQLSGGQLPHELIERIAVLADEDDPAVREEGERDGSAGMFRDLPYRPVPGGIFNVVDDDVEDPALVEPISF